MKIVDRLTSSYFLLMFSAFSQCLAQCKCSGNPVNTMTCTGSSITSVPKPSQMTNQITKMLAG